MQVLLSSEKQLLCSSLCFYKSSHYFPFNGLPFIWVLFSCIERYLVNKGSKSIKMDGFLINRKTQSLWNPLCCFTSSISKSGFYLFPLKVGCRKINLNKKLWDSLVWSVIRLSHMFTPVVVCFCHFAVMKEEKKYDRETCVITAGHHAASSHSVIFIPRPIWSVDSTYLHLEIWMPV